MQKRVFIVHGWDGYPEEGWFPWLKKELEAKGFSVVVPQLPKADEPRINNWVPELKRAVGNPDEQTYFVGHSMGCQTIARYLETLSEDVKVGGVVFVAGFFKKLTNLENDNVVKSVSDEWLKTPVNLRAISKHIKTSIAIFSDNDPYVPIENKDDFAGILGSEVIIEHSKNHFSGSTGTTQLPIALESVLKIAGEWIKMD
ncbi:MAG: serine hydrolase family protein [Patescibacteria group bacterium]|nr:serine hydrolase family protein [Patescibacteria group bacterium]